VGVVAAGGVEELAEGAGPEAEERRLARSRLEERWLASRGPGSCSRIMAATT